MKKITIAAALVATLTSCKQRNDTAAARQIAKAEWLIGAWENKMPNGTLSENWEEQNDSVFKGQSFFIHGKDTIHSESMVLLEEKGTLIYRPTVKGQNADKPIDFKLTSATDKQLVFENPGHDFPQKISYTKITNDSLVAEISGQQQGKPVSEKFGMKKKP
ncbi:DUF6265 domain-containing protein [Flavobacterium longum]|uniref:DUF6265 family protein n=1 Tax=Flavobacterium longum TaxID=1299340 RepID=UPI0039EC6401